MKRILPPYPYTFRSSAAELVLKMGRGLGNAFAGERERWATWLPVCLGLGIGLYFALPLEPPWWSGIAFTLAVAAAAMVGRRRPVLLVAMVALGTMAAGFAVAQWRTAAVATPMLKARHGPTAITGSVIQVEILSPGLRVTLDHLELPRLDAARVPERARLRLGGRQPALKPGDRMTVFGVLTPPPSPAAPGAFDFQRQSYFRRLGAVGYSMGTARLLPATEPGLWNRLRLGLARLRQDIAERARNAIGGAAGSIAAALMTGNRGAIPAPVMASIRDSGLAHLLAISGLHIGLVAGILFVGLRGGLALAAPLAVRYPIKKWAAAVALPGALAYALVAGATVPTQRAFLMIGLVLVAVLLDRRGISMRTVAWAAVVILLLQPESLLGASFQMSFAAVTALVAAYEWLRAHRPFVDAPAWRRWIMFYLGGVALTTLIAGTATAPFAIYHFNRFAAYGLAANLIAVPVTALWIMPWAVAAFMLLPMGWEVLALVPMGLGIEVVIGVAETVSAWPGAVALLPAMPAWGLASVALGGVWLCLWRGRWRLWGLAGVAAGMATLLVHSGPHILVDDQGKLLAARSASGLLTVSSRRLARFERDVWLRREGQEEEAPLWPTSGTSADGRMSCDSLGCIYRARDHVVALVRRPEALAEDCWMADVVVSTVPVRGRCPSAHTVIDRFDLWRDGAHALWLNEEKGAGGVRVESANGVRGRRPWVLSPADEEGD